MLRSQPPRLNLALLPILLLVALLAACGSGNAPAAGDGSPALEATATARAAQQPATPQPTAVVPPGDLVYTSGRNDDGTYFLGEPDAPVTLIDYSDFL
jgi:hypothetical protein